MPTGWNVSRGTPRLVCHVIVAKRPIVPVRPLPVEIFQMVFALSFVAQEFEALQNIVQAISLHCWSVSSPVNSTIVIIFEKYAPPAKGNGATRGVGRVYGAKSWFVDSCCNGKVENVPPFQGERFLGLFAPQNRVSAWRVRHAVFLTVQICFTRVEVQPRHIGCVNCSNRFGFHSNPFTKSQPHTTSAAPVKLSA